MKTIAVITIPFIVYFGLGWLAKDIYFYFNEITGYTTMKEIYNGEIIAAYERKAGEESILDLCRCRSSQRNQ